MFKVESHYKGSLGPPHLSTWDDADIACSFIKNMMGHGYIEKFIVTGPDYKVIVRPRHG